VSIKKVAEGLTVPVAGHGSFHVPTSTLNLPLIG
jgi:hypothetical protein